MKRKIIKLWGVGLIVVLLASLVVAAPASAADPLQWNQEAIPEFPAVLAPAGTDITDLAIAADGLTMYAATGTTTVYKSIDGGLSWTPCVTTGLGDSDLIAVAPDNSDYVAVADTATYTVYISTKGGSTPWGSLSIPQDGTDACDNINDIDISPAAPDNALVVAGDDDNGDANAWVYKLGVGGAWDQLKDKGTGFEGGTGMVLAVKFSSNYPSDEVLTAVSQDGTNTYYEMYSMNSGQWNEQEASFGAGYPVTMIANDLATSASIALAPTYLGGDPIERVAFVGTWMGDTGSPTDADNGVYRLKDANCVEIQNSTRVHSVAYDGVSIMAGTTGTTVFRCEDPLVTTPTFFPSSSTKSPGGSSNTVVGFSGTTVVAGTSGDESAFAMSDDNGESFNDVSLIDTAIVDIEDVAAAADGAKVYLLTNDAGNDAAADNFTDLSVWRYASTWQRVLSVVGTVVHTSYKSYIVRVSPDDADVAYVAQKAGTSVYYTKDGGEGKWYSRTASAVVDIAVESTDVAYLGTGTGVRKTSNGGFTWGPPPTDAKLGGNVYSIACIGEDQLVVGGDNGKVSYSVDGNGSYIPIPTAITGTPSLIVNADGLGEGNNIYTGSTTGLRRWTVGQSSAEPWKDIDPGAANVTGLKLLGGFLYAACTDGAASFIRRSDAAAAPTPPPFDNIADDAGEAKVLDIAPSSITVSSTDYSTKIWAATGATLYSYDDTLTQVAPTLIGPANGTKVSINPLSGVAYDVNFTWGSVANIGPDRGYGLIISLDEAGDEAVTAGHGPDGIAVAGAGGPVVSKLVGPSTSQTDLVTYMAGVTYYWRVKVTNPIHSPASEVRSFTIEAGAAVVPEIGSPANGGTVTETPAFSWSPVAGATMYTFELSTDTVFAVPLYSADQASTGLRPDIVLDPGTYFWRVKVLSPIPGDWSTIANFTVAAPAPPPSAAAPPVEVTVPKIEIPPITVPPAEVQVQPAAPAEPAISQGLLWAIIIIGAVLVIAVIVLIVRTRRTV